MQGIPRPVVARLLGHAQVQMTLRYAHVSDRDVEAAAERIGGVMRGSWIDRPIGRNLRLNSPLIKWLFPALTPR